MKLEETIKKMRETNDDSKFYPLIEGMKRRADKGLLEGVTSADIDTVVSELERAPDHTKNNVSIMQEMFEINEAIEKFDYMDVENYSEELLESLILYEFAMDIESLNEESNYDYYDENDKYVKKERRNKIRSRVNQGLVIGGAGTLGVKFSGKARLEKLKKAEEKAALADTAGIAASGKSASDYASSRVGDLESKLGNDWKVGFGMVKDTGKKVGKALWKPIKHFGGAVTNALGITTGAAANPLLSVVGAGMIGAAGYGAYKLIKYLRKKRQERLSENFVDIPEVIFSNEIYKLLKEAISELTEDEIIFLKENGCDDTKEILFLIEKAPEALEEAVTYIDNAGNLKTTSTPDYVKSMHEYDTDTQIAKYEKKKKRRDYKLISEEIDIDNIKKLSEMSFEDILNEDLYS